jgi:hypothetical protein
MATQPVAVPLKSLVSALGEAVNAALARHKVHAPAKIAIGDGIICGPLLEKAVGLNVAEQIAQEVAAKAHSGALQAHAQLTHAVLSGPHHIICGVVIDPREGIIVE